MASHAGHHSFGEWLQHRHTLHDLKPGAAVGTVAVILDQIVASKRLDERTEDLTIESPAVGDQVNVRLLLPATYKSEKSRRWPVLYLLHGCCDTYVSWTRSTDITKLTEDSDLIVATPDGGPAGFYSDPYWTEMGNVPYRRVTEPAGTALPRQRCRRRCGGLNGGSGRT